MAGGRALEADTLPTVGFCYLVVARASRGNANVSSAPASPAIAAQSPAGCGSAVPVVIGSARTQGASGLASQGPTAIDGSRAPSARVYCSLGLSRKTRSPGAHVKRH